MVELTFIVHEDFARLVTDAAHKAEDAVGHTDGFCRTCSAIYTAVMVALPDAKYHSKRREGEPLCKFCKTSSCYEEYDELVCRGCDKVDVLVVDPTERKVIES